MSLNGRLLTWLLKLPPAETSGYTVKHDVPVTMPDGVVLLAEHYIPNTDKPCPTLLTRTPYGRRGWANALGVIPYVERGYQVFIQSCRGTDGSGGEFAFARNERADGLATIAWLKQQPWFNGQLATVGPSYMGFVQWAVAAEASSDITAMVLTATTSDAHRFRAQGGAMTLESMLGWSTMMTIETASGPAIPLPRRLKWERDLERAYHSLPLDQADRLVVGAPSFAYQEWFAHPFDDPYWKAIDFSDRVDEITAPIALQAGWYDLFLDWQLKDYQRLRDAGRNPSLIIGPWHHLSPSAIGPQTRDQLAWLDAKVKGKTERQRANPVQIYVMGANEWREYPSWPPASQPQRWHLQPGHELTVAAPTLTNAPDRYRYDPANPTPTVGGNTLGALKRMGPKDNRPLEARADVVTYTSAPLTNDLEVIGPVTADLYVSSSLDYTDFFARLCVVEPSGKSINLCEGILSLTPENSQPDSDGIRHIQVAIWPTAYRFRKGQRIRAQISSGSHPRFARNPGTGEPLATATKLLTANQAIYHDAAHPSAFILPVIE